MTITVRPLSFFPPPETAERRKAPFIRPAKWEHYEEGGQPRAREARASGPTPIGQTLRELERELDLIPVSEAVLELDVRERDLRRDGGIRADARPFTPRVILSFTHPKAGPLRYPCDTYERWEDNVRAIRLALEALRAVDRYGITRRAEQYAGWRALPASTDATLTSEAAARIIVANDPMTASWDPTRATAAVREILRSEPVMRASTRRALAITHPDAGGYAERFDMVAKAREILKRHHGVRETVSA